MLALVNTRHEHARTLLQRLHGLERDLKLIGRVEGRGVVLDLNAEERDDRHGAWFGWVGGVEKCTGGKMQALG